MNKIDAIRVSTAWTDSETLKSELKVELNSIEYQAILTNIDNYDTTLSYLSGIIWKYYKSYYLITSTKERCIELLANELSGKLNYYYALINQYKEAYNKNYETIRSSENTNDRNITTSRTGFNKQATTPETIDAGAEYIDNYSTSQQKYNSSGTELGKNTFKSNISGSSKELWENINAIPKRIYEGIIGLVSKYFFYVYDDDLVPCVELTLEQAIKELNEKLGLLEVKVETNSVNIRTIGGIVDDLQRRERVLTESIENLTNVTPTDIDYNEGFTLMHDTTEITGQTSKVKLGTNLTYNPITKTINATGGDTAIITLSDSQAIEISKAKITFTEEQFNIIKKQGFIKLNYNNNTIISGIVTYYNNNNGYSLEGLFYNPLIGNSSVLIYIPNEYNYTQLNINVYQFVNRVDFAINTNNFSIQYNKDYSNNAIYLDKINNTSIIHTREEDVKNYEISKYYGHYITIITKSNKPTSVFTIYLVTKDSSAYTNFNDFKKYLPKNAEFSAQGYVRTTDDTLYDISRLSINSMTDQLVSIYYTYPSTFNAVDASVITKPKQTIDTVKLNEVHSISDEVIEL